jgi:hypothetical protein
VSIDEKRNTMNNVSNYVKAEKFSTVEVTKALQKLKLGKSNGIDGIKNEHFKYASPRLHILLTLCVNAMLTHGYMCTDMMKTVLVPIVKDKNDDLSSVDNYRPIAITTASSKIVELLFLERLSVYMECHDNQFGFKSSHSTDMCVYVLKQIISFYSECNSPLVVTYLDASKAFDRVNFYKLFDKLMYRGVPAIYIRLLMFWYTHQEFMVRWGGTFSGSFLVGNGVRQGGVLSPVLFNVYMDGLSSVLNTLNTGCYFNGVLINHLMYADDLVIISPSIRSMQILLSHCDSYADLHDVKFNTKKSKCMLFKSDDIQITSGHNLFLSSKKLTFVSEHNYLGVILCSNECDDFSIDKQCKGVYARGNFILRHFRQCTDEVKILLFNSYCTSFYCSALWHCSKSSSIRRLKTAYNRIFRLFFCIIGQVSISWNLLTRNLNPFEVLLRKCSFNLRSRLYNSNNSIVDNIVNSTFSMTSKLHQRWDKTLFNF